MGDVQGAGSPPQPGWYADPGGQPLLRWWDGTAWTDYLTDAGGPPPPPPTPGRAPTSGRLVIGIVVGVVLGLIAVPVLVVGACIALLGGFS